jgi:hypothetical protein
MAQVELVHSQGIHQISVVHLITKCNLFKNNPGLTMTPYRVQCEVSLEELQDFISALEDKSININDRNFPGLSQLSEEFGFEVFLTTLSSRRRLPGLPEAQRMQYLSRISTLEKQAGQHERQLAAFQSLFFAAVRRFETDLVRLASELKAVCDAKNSESTAVPLNKPAKSPPRTMPSVPALPARMESLIVREYPPLFEEFRMKQWLLLWRGSRDGFGAAEFHYRCDGHANTLTLILDTKGNIFGGFTPVEWESRMPISQHNTRNCWKSDSSLKSFLFTLNNPSNTEAMKFELGHEKSAFAVWCCSSDGPWFGGNGILVCDDSNPIYTSTSDHTYDFGYHSKVYNSSLLMGSHEFKVKEIEVFEVVD